MKKLIVLLAILPVLAFGQASYFSGTAQTTRYINGIPAAGPLPLASVFVCNYPGPCTVANTAVIYTDATAVTQAPNPFSADVNGTFGFWATPGNYQYTFTYKGITFGPFPISSGGGNNGAQVLTKTLATIPTPSPDGMIYKLSDGQRGLYITSNGLTRPISTDINVQDFGARGDGGWYSQVQCANGSGTIQNVGTIGGRIPKVGDNIAISGCGAAGATLTGTISGGTATTGTPFGTVTLSGGVTASANLTNRGARWGVSIDDTSAFAAAITACSTSGQTNGCRIRVPVGVFFVSNLTFPAIASIAQGQVIIQGVGRTSSWLIGIGANQTAILTAPSGSVSTFVQDLGFQSFDYRNNTQIAVQWVGGTEHAFTNNYVTNMYEMVSAANTWINSITWNRCYFVTHCVEFGGSAGTGPVNATWVDHNEMAAFSGHAIYTHTNNASYGNTFGPNSIENDNPPFDTPVYISDNQSEFIEGYSEQVAPTSGYFMELLGTGSIIRMKSLQCTRNVLGGNTFIVAGLGANCSGQTYVVNNLAGSNKFYGMSPTKVSVVQNADDFIGGTSTSGVGSQFSGGALKTYQSAAGSANDWPNGRVDLNGVPFAISNYNSSNPTYPTQFGTSAVVPRGTIVWRNAAPQLGFYTGNGILQCNNGSNCAVNPPVAGDWIRGLEWYTKVHTENSGINLTAVPWTAGDGYWNTAPNAAGIAYYVVTVGGSPGTHRPMQIQGGANAVSFSATPTFDASGGTSFKITLTGNVTSSTLSNAYAGQTLVFQICQDSTGSRTFVYPANVKGADAIGGTLSTCSVQMFVYDGTNAYAVAAAKTNM